MIRMKQKQSKDAYSLIRKQCCNYDSSTGGCLLLDDGEVVHCPQLISQSLICKWFRDAVLPGNKALRAEIMGADYRKVCQVCGQHFRAISNRAKYCSRCAKKVERERKAGWAQKNRKRVDV